MNGEYRDFGEDRSVRRPATDPADIDASGGSFEDEIDLADIRVSSGDHREARGWGEIARSVLKGVDLSESRLGPLTLSDVSFHNVRLDNAQWHGVAVRRGELTDCHAVGWGVSVDLASDLYVADCRLDFARLNLERVKGLAVFERCSFRAATIGGNLAGAVFLDCEFADAEFAAKAAVGCDLRSSRLSGANGLMSLRGARITADQLVSIAERLAVEAGFRVEP